jgi:hypothetical protein
MPRDFCRLGEIFSEHNPSVVLGQSQVDIFVSQDLESCHNAKGYAKTVQLVT